MTVEQKLKELICERYGSIIEFSKRIKMANSTLNSILNRGVQKASIGNIIRICEELGISADELANDRIVFITRNKKEDIETINIEKMIELAKLNISTYNIKLDNIELTSLEVNYIFNSLELALEFIRRTRKEDI